ncbi:MAG: leucine-rich repeat domain-containing protein [Gelidibacter sp.]
MIYSIDGNILSVDGNMIERRVNTLVYQYKGDVFPKNAYNNDKTGVFTFTSIGPNSITINYGDGNIVSKVFEVSGALYYAQYSYADNPPVGHIHNHIYNDGFIGMRNISFEFEFPNLLKGINVNRLYIYGNLPSETSFFPNITSIKYQRCFTIESIPDSFPENLEEYTVSEVMSSKVPKLPDTLFNTTLHTLSINSSYDLSDIISSNFFKINQLNNLESLGVNHCDIKKLPDSISECTKLYSLFVRGNLFTEIPVQLGELSNLEILQVGSDSALLINKSIPVWSNLKKLRQLRFDFSDCIISDIADSWKYLYSLSNMLTMDKLAETNLRFNEFIDAFYELCTTNGNIVNNSSSFGGVYPYRFRNISWGLKTRLFNGIKQAPIGYVQGVSNGTPANQGEKVYVLQNQYNHTVTHA